ncbi:MAG: SOS response-associated peptidase family protein [Aquaticitalea sp.]
MFYKLSNTATLENIEKEFNLKFEYPNLYRPSTVINGLEESILSMITMENPDKLSYGIWGLLPSELEDNWKVFQNLTNTLNINVEHLDPHNDLYSEALDYRRCIIVITGFYTSALHDGKMYPHHVHLKDHRPFGVAGVYNQLGDGFITTSILVSKTKNSMRRIPNMLPYKPVIFDARDQMEYLNKSLKYNDLKNLISSHHSLELLSNPVSKQIYDNDVVI